MVWAITLVAMLSVSAPAPALGTAFSTPSIDNTPLNLVILVDESGSESNADIKHEAEAAATIAQTPLNPQSRVTVVGFGGADGAKPNQDPTTVACQPTITSGVTNLEYLARCVSRLHRRTAAQGDNTDYAAALAQAMTYLSPGTPYSLRSPADAIKAIVMMTDGGLDVTGDPQYPQPNWQTAAHNAVNLQLAAARSAGVQVWPLGFGDISAANGRYLDYLAANGGQARCDQRQASRPHAVVAQNSATAQAAVYSLYSAAACFGVSKSTSTVVTGGHPRLLTVTIPPIANDVAISVNKGSPAIQADYVSPSGASVTNGSLGGSNFSVSGQDTAVEVLHVTNPQAGQWQIRLTAPAGLRGQLVSATAFWQGAVRVSLFASPPTARPGQRINVVLTVLGPRGAITDPSLLSAMHVGVAVAGDGLTAPIGVPVMPAGANAGPGLAAGDYIGTFVAPSKPGTLTFTGTAAGYGLHATEVPTQVTVGSQAALLEGTVQFTQPSAVYPGQAIHGQILFSNQTGRGQPVRLALAASLARVSVTSPQGQVTVPSGTSAIPFTIKIAPGSPTGSAVLTVKAVDAGNPAISYGAQQLLFTVSKPPGPLAKYRWEILGAVLLLILIGLAAVLRRAARRRRANVQGLVAQLVTGHGVVHELATPRKWARTFEFVIHGDDTDEPRLHLPRSGERGYSVRRADHGQVSVRTPDGAEQQVSVGDAGIDAPGGIRVSFRDARRARRPAGPPPGGQPPPDLHDASGPHDSADPQATAPGEPYEYDPFR